MYLSINSICFVNCTYIYMLVYCVLWLDRLLDLIFFSDYWNLRVFFLN